LIRTTLFSEKFHSVSFLKREDQVGWLSIMPTSFQQQLLLGWRTRRPDTTFTICELAAHFHGVPNNVIFNMGIFSIRNIDVAIVSQQRWQP